MLTHHRVTPRIKFASTLLYTCVERGTVTESINFASPNKALPKLKLANAQPFFYSEYEQGNDSTCVKFKQIEDYEYTRIHFDPGLNTLHAVNVMSIYSTIYVFKSKQ